MLSHLLHAPIRLTTRASSALAGGAVLALLLAGCATTGLTPVRDSGARVEGPGFSVLPPPGSGWYRMPDVHLDGSDGVGFTKQSGSENHTLAVLVTRHEQFDPAAVGFSEYATKPDVFAAFVQSAARNANPPGGRMRTLESTVAPDTRLGYGVRGHYVFEDRGSTPKGLIQEDRVYTVLHPASPRVIIEVCVSERGPLGEKDPAVAGIIDAVLKGLEFRPL